LSKIFQQLQYTERISRFQAMIWAAIQPDNTGLQKTQKRHNTNGKRIGESIPRANIISQF